MHLLNIAIVDDHPLFREGLRNLLRNLNEVGEIVAVDCFEKLKAFCENSKVDLILMDVDLGENSGIEWTQKIIGLFPEMKILTLSANVEREAVFKMLQAGVLGYVSKDLDLGELKEAIRTVVKGKNYFSNMVTKQLVFSNQKRREHIALKEKLTLRELEIVNFIIKEELSNQEIANRLFISARTVETHKRNIIQKLQVKNVIGLAKYYFQYQMTFN